MTTPADWHRLVRGWTVAFWLSLTLATVYVVTAERIPADGKVRALGALAVLGLAYAVSMSGLSRRRPRSLALGYLVVAVVVVGIACSVDSSLSMLLWIVYSQVWMFTPSIRFGVAFATAVSLSAFLGFGVQFGFAPQPMREVGLSMAASLLFSVLLGVWVSRIIDQSVERAALIADLEAARTELAAAEHARGVLAERERMSREIHDTLAQGFTSVVTLAQAASAALERHPGRVPERLAAIEQVARDNLAEARALVAAFTPVDLAGSTLAQAVLRLADRFAAETGIAVSVDVDGAGVLGADREIVLLRAVQEALANVRRHADARHVDVRLVVDAEGARVEVGDDGVGFTTATPTRGFGLSGMRSRVAEVGGDVDVASLPGAGTRVVVRVPA